MVNLAAPGNAPPLGPPLSCPPASATEPRDVPTADGDRRRSHRFLLTSLPFLAAVAFRAVVDVGQAPGPRGWAAVAAFAAFGMLLAAEPTLSRRARWYPSLYAALQTALVTTLLLLLGNPDRDYFAALFIPLSGQALLLFPRRVGYRWVGVFVAALAAGLVIVQGPTASVPFVLLYAGACVFAASYASLLVQTEAAREHGRRLLADLRAAYHRLETQSAQAEALAAMDERTRIARDLHDSVTQTLFGLGLAAETAARALDQGRPALAAAQVRDVQESARQALAELRLLVFELRPPVVAGDGLAASLRARLEAVEGRAGLAVDVDVEGEDRLPTAVAAELDAIAREALNNVLKHAHARRVTVRLRLAGTGASLVVADDGIGFDPAASGGGLGLRGMGERAARVGGAVAVVSRPGAGARVEATIPPRAGR